MTPLRLTFTPIRIGALLLALAGLGIVTHFAGWGIGALALGLLLVATDAALTLHLLRRQALPLASLRAAVQRLAGGDTGTPADEALPGDYGQLAKDINKFLAILRSNEARSLLARRQVQRLGNFYAALSATNQSMVRMKEPQELYEALCHIVTETGHASMAWVGAIEGKKMVPCAWSSERARGYTRDLDIHWDPAVPGTIGPTAAAVLAGKPYICNDYYQDPRTAAFRDKAKAYGVQSAAAFPLTVGERIVGVLNIYADELDFFDGELVALLTEMAADVSFGLAALAQERARVQAEKQLAASLRNMREVFDLLPAYVVLVSVPEVIFRDVNTYACDLFGLERSQIVGRSAQELERGFQTEDVPYVLDAVEKNGVLRNFETKLRVGNGQVRDVLVNIRRTSYAGAPANLVIAIDVTERKQAQRAVEQQDKQMRSLIESALDAIIAVDEAQRVVVFNKAAARMFGVPKEEALGSPLSRFIPEKFRQSHEGYVGRLLQDGTAEGRMASKHPVVGLRANGELFPIEATVSRTFDGSGVRGTAIIRDMTSVREAEQARLQAAAAEAASKAKTAFLARMSHELRTPLNAVLGFSQLLQESTKRRLSDDERKQLDHIFLAGAQLRALIDDVLDVSRIEEGRIDVELRNVELCGLVDSAMRMCEPQANAHMVELRKPRGQALAPLEIRTDPLRLRQVLLNLLSNAIKYNRPGGWVNVSLEKSTEFIHLRVADNGIGMTPQQQAELFQPFNRLGRERGSIPGTGLGMVLVRQLVELLGGLLAVESEPGRGTVLRVSLPNRAPILSPLESRQREENPDSIAPALEDTPAPSGVVLYIEDNPVNVLLAEQLLSKWPNVQMVAAEDGKQGLAKARELLPDLLLLDIQLPDMTGEEVLVELQRHEETAGIAVVALSASAMAEDVQRILAAGARDYWTKPIDFGQFHAGVRRFLSSEQDAREELPFTEG